MSELVVYQVFRTPFSYIGELEKQTESEIVLSRVLILQQHGGGRGGDDSEQVTIGNVPFASRDSKVSLNRQAMPGVLIANLDEDLKTHYGKEIVAAYSKLKVIA